MIGEFVQTVAVTALPVLLAVTLHEAAHGYVAERFGDDTARRMGRISMNPLRHIDPFGTVILPLMMIAGTGMIFGYAKPVPVDFRRLRNPRRDMIWVALAGPGINLLLAVLAGFLYQGLIYLPAGVAEWAKDNTINLLFFNVMLGVFNMLPIPPLDGGRVAVGVLPARAAYAWSRLERPGILIVLAAVFLLPMLGREIGVDLDVARWLILEPSQYLSQLIWTWTGNG